MLPGFTERECLAADLRRRELLQTVLSVKSQSAAMLAVDDGQPSAAVRPRPGSPSIATRVLGRIRPLAWRPTTAAAKG